MQGLQQHLEASHSLFVYAFQRDPMNSPQMVNVMLTPELQMPVHRFNEPFSKEELYSPEKVKSV